jgi:hypothetical protein
MSKNYVKFGQDRFLKYSFEVIIRCSLVPRVTGEHLVGLPMPVSTIFRRTGTTMTLDRLVAAITSDNISVFVTIVAVLMSAVALQTS